MLCLYLHNQEEVWCDVIQLKFFCLHTTATFVGGKVNIFEADSAAFSTLAMPIFKLHANHIHYQPTLFLK